MNDNPNNSLQKDLKKQNLRVRVINPDITLFDGEARAISLINDRGPFDILPGHENFISIIKNKIVILTPDKQKKEIPIVSAVVKVYENQIDIFAGVETLAEAPPSPTQKLLEI